MKINFDSPYKVDDGYGNAGEQILLALDRHPEVEVFTDKNWPHTTTTTRGLERRTVDLFSRGFNNRADFSIRFSQPDSFSNAPPCTNKKIGWSMWEFTHIPKAWVPGSNSVPAVFVPCTHNKRIWEEAGTKVPVYVVPLGVDKSIFYYRPDNDFTRPKAIASAAGGLLKPRNTFDVFTFVISGTVCGRKNHNMVHRVFRRLFSDKHDVRLLIKTPSWAVLKYESWHNVEVYCQTWNKVRIADLLRECDCFVYPTQGEGFGLSPVEAMAVGNTAIVTNWSGPADYLNSDYTYLLDYEVTGQVGSHWGDTFGFAQPKEKHLEELMWHVYTHQDEAREKGRKAAKYVSENLTWAHTASKIVDILRRL